MSNFIKVTIVILSMLSFFHRIENEGTGGAKNYQPACADPNSITSSNVITEWPLDSYVRVSQKFNYLHPAIDIGAINWTPIRASGYGFVYKSEWMKDGYGWYVEVNHPDGWQTLYAHMIQKPNVNVGDYIFPGKILGYVGSTGHSSGPHVHFEVLLNNCQLNPLALFPDK